MFRIIPQVNLNKNGQLMVICCLIYNIFIVGIIFCYGLGSDCIVISRNVTIGRQRLYAMLLFLYNIYAHWW